MRKNPSVSKTLALAFSVAALAGLALHPAIAAAAPGTVRYEVSVTNLTRGQIFSPAVVATHSPHQPPLFVLGQPASPELASVAEDAVLDPLVGALEASPFVASAGVLTDGGGPILPGKTGTLVVETSYRATRLSLVGMLVTTNDGFYSVHDSPIPRFGSSSFLAEAYDAGSETNSESCVFIPGPPCGNGGVRDTAGAEGFVHIHAGIHGIDDLDAAEHDWRNPVALIRVRRLGPGE